MPHGEFYFTIASQLSQAHQREEVNSNPAPSPQATQNQRNFLKKLLKHTGVKTLRKPHAVCNSARSELELWVNSNSPTPPAKVPFTSPFETQVYSNSPLPMVILSSPIKTWVEFKFTIPHGEFDFTILSDNSDLKQI